MEKRNKLKNTGRFFLALILGVLFIFIIGLLLVLLYPLIIGGSILLFIFTFVISIIVAIGGFVAFFWYLARKEPDIENGVDYSIDQGKEVK